MTDTERLDWLDKNHWNVICKMPKKRTDPVRWFVGAEEAYTEAEGATVREAIDACHALEGGK